MPKVLSSRNVQAIVSGDVHKALRDEALDRNDGTTLRDLIREVLTQHVAEKEVSKDKP